MIGYKHVPQQYAADFAAGRSIRVGTTTAYRAMENSRADRLEGVAEYVIGSVRPDDWLSPEHRQARVAIGFPADMSHLPDSLIHNIVFHDNIYRTVLAPTYIMCLSSEPDLDRAKAERECVFRISDLDLFGHRMSKVCRSLQNMQVGKVIYEDRSVDPFQQGVLRNGPFRKSKDFHWENEIRIVWSRSHISDDFLNVSAPRAARLITCVYDCDA